MSDVLSALLALTDRVEHLVGTGDWVAATQVESERQQLLEQYVAQSPKDTDTLRALFDRSCRTLELAQAQRRRLLDESGQLSRRRRALDAYTARGPSARVGGARG